MIVLCLTASLFMIRTTVSQSTREYDPWYDINDDGKIDIKDIYGISLKYGTNGEPINKTQIILDLQNRVKTLEEQQNYVKTIRLYTPNETLKEQGVYSKIAATFVWAPHNITDNAIMQCYCSFKYISLNDAMTFRIMINGVETVYGTTPGTSTEYTQSALWQSYQTDFMPNNSTYTIQYELHGTEATAKYVKDINILIEVMDGLPPS